MTRPLMREEDVYQSVLLGDLTIDSQGRVWRLASRRWNQQSGTVTTIPCTPRRAEKIAGAYLQVRVMANGVRVHALAHRLVWRHFHGPIPDGLTINHKNGAKTDNRPSNLELATSAEQVHHARNVLRRGRLNQFGTRNAMAKLSESDVREICARRADGELLRVIAADYGVAFQTIAKIVTGQRRSLG